MTTIDLTPQEATNDPLPLAPVSIGVRTTSVVSYAMAHNRITPVPRIELRAESELPLRDVTVEAWVRAATGEQLSQVWRRHLTDLRTSGLPFDNVDLMLDAGAMAAVDEQRPAAVEVAVHVEGFISVATRAPLTVLAHNQWGVVKGSSWRLAAELLCAFVQPNHPAVTQVVSDASAILAEQTGRSSVDGYQGGTARVHAIARAVWEALQARRIRYSNPPASWDTDPTDPQLTVGGQKVRTAQQVLDDRFGTCLDTSVLYAAALEQAGLRPLLWLPDGHAFVGYWTVEDAGIDGGYADTAIGPIANAVDMGLMRLVETTLLCDREPPATHADAVRAPQTYASDRADEVRAVVDVAAARRSGIIPLPARAVSPDGAVTVVEYKPQAIAAPIIVSGPGRTTGREGRSPEPDRVFRWKARLLDLTRRNKLISFSTKTSGIDLHVPSGALAALEDVLNKGRSFTLAGRDDLTAAQLARGLQSVAELPDDLVVDDLLSRRKLRGLLPGTDVDRRSRTLATKARTVFQETGANVLYVTIGMLRWRIAEGHDVRSPLILLPVRLKPAGRGRPATLELDETGQETPNFCLIEKLRRDHGLDIPGLATPETDGDGLDIDALFRTVREAIVTHGLDAQVEEAAALAVLDYARYPLWRDIDEHWELFARNKLVRHLIEAPDQHFIDDVAPPAEPPDLDALAAKCPVSADSAQLEAVAAAVRGETFVLEGPPGTGKSQTITNLLARAMADGRTVLFVAEKAAALDVVKRRIDEVGLGPFALDIHDRASKPAQIRKQLLDALELHVEHDSTEHRVAAERLRSRVTTLRGYSEQLHAKGATGLSAYAARNAVLTHGDGPTITIPQRFVSARGGDTLEQLRGAVVGLDALGQATRPSPDHPWAFLNAPRARDLTRLNDDALTATVHDIDDALTALDRLPDHHPVRAAVDVARDGDDLTVLAELLAPGVPGLDILDEAVSPRWRQAAEQLRAGLEQVAHGVADHAATPALWALPADDLAHRATEAAAAGFFVRGGRLKKLLPELAPGTTRTLTKKDVAATAQGFGHLTAAARQVWALAAAMPGVSVPPDLNPLIAEHRAWLLHQVDTVARLAAAAAGRTGDFAARLREALVAAPEMRTVAAADLRRLADGVAGLRAMLYVGDDEWSVWLADHPFLAAWTASSARRQMHVDASPVRAVEQWMAFVAALRPFADAGLHEAYRQLLTGVIPADQAGEALARGEAHAALAERLAAHGFTEFDADMHERVIDSYNGQAPMVRELLTTALPAELTRRRTFDADNPAGQIGALRRELAKERRGRSIRQLVEEFGELILSITPCVLVSPASLARFFPPGSVTFDMVVFDEASQVRVADAIGAMGRARSVVVVGDSKQMPPSTIMETSVIADEEDSLPDGVERVTEDEESILSECVSARVLRRWLTWHYRSEDESLIAFSNASFYESKLATFPGPSGRRPGFGVHLRRVDGHFHRPGDKRDGDGPLRTNIIEARAVVVEIERRFAAHRDERPSMGVVTFNLQQRDLITDLLLRSEDDAIVEAVEDDGAGSLFVKNLENVQGDERDTILFSTGFSANAKGVVPLTFGPLNLKGGERRLNVAVTRARREVMVFASFAPEQLRTEGTPSQGVRLLRTYLDMAQRGPEGSGDTVSRMTVVKDRHRDDVVAALQARGWSVSPDVGLSQFKVDLAVADPAVPERALLAVLLDGPAWASRRTVGDRDGLPVEVLQHRMGWPSVARVWLPSWLRDAGAVVDRLDALLREIRDNGVVLRQSQVSADDWLDGAAAAMPKYPAPPLTPGSSAPRSLAIAPINSLRAAPASTTSDSHDFTAHEGSQSRASRVEFGGITIVPFEPWTPGVRGTADLLDEHWHQPTLRGVVRECLEQEAPIPAERLAKLVANAYGLTRVTLTRQQRIVSLIQHDTRIDREEVVWRADQDPDGWPLVRTSEDNTERPLTHVPLRELCNAMVVEAVAAAGLTEDELFRASLARFGGRRITEGIRARLIKSLRQGVREGRLVDSGGRFVAPSRGVDSWA